MDGRKAVLIQDEFQLSRAVDLAWGITTDAELELAGSTAILRKGSKSLKAQILSPAGATFAVESAERKPPETPNQGKSRLVVRLVEQSGAVRIAVFLAPVWPDSGASSAPQLQPLTRW